MGETTIKTNHNWRQFVYIQDVPRHILESQFDYMAKKVYVDDDSVAQLNFDDAPSDGFFCYHGHWYHTSNFMRLENNPPSAFAGYHGYSSDSFFSGVLIKLADDGERYQIATYIG